MMGRLEVGVALLTNLWPVRARFLLPVVPPHAPPSGPKPSSQKRHRAEASVRTVNDHLTLSGITERSRYGQPSQE